MTSLTAIFGSTNGASGDSEKLLELYWNRAELKKEFAKLREQTFKLRKEIENREGARLRLEQKLDQLEKLLLDPDWMFSVVTFYQLRSLDERCRAKVSNFAEQIKRQREKKRHGRLREAWQARRLKKLAALGEQLADARLELQRLEDRLQAERYRYSMMGPLRRFVRRRSVARTLDGIVADIAGARDRETRLVEQVECIREKKPPDTQGLDIASKRSINFMILSFAQQLYLHFADGDLAELGKEAAEKSPGAIRYGTRADCERLLGMIEERIAAFQRAPIDTVKLQKRAKLLADSATFPATDEAVPEAASVGTVYRIAADGSISARDVSLLAADYWNLSRILSR